MWAFGAIKCRENSSALLCVVVCVKNCLILEYGCPLVVDPTSLLS